MKYVNINNLFDESEKDKTMSYVLRDESERRFGKVNYHDISSIGNRDISVRRNEEQLISNDSFIRNKPYSSLIFIRNLQRELNDPDISIERKIYTLKITNKIGKIQKATINCMQCSIHKEGLQEVQKAKVPEDNRSEQIPLSSKGEKGDK